MFNVDVVYESEITIKKWLEEEVTIFSDRSNLHSGKSRLHVISLWIGVQCLS